MATAEIPRLTPELAEPFARIALAGVRREWPHSFQHLANGPADVQLPRALHPAFYGCYDWHSAVHGHWTLARLRRLFPRLAANSEIRTTLSENLTAKNLAAELEYFRAPGRSSFERPYGWAWLLALAAELRTANDAASRRWARAVRPLEEFVAGSFCSWLPRQRFPVRSGAHSNTAFALTLALDYARAARHRELEKIIVARSRAYFLADVHAPAAWEPSGEDFLSPALTEADLMRRALARAEFAAWWRRFLPELSQNLRAPADPGDRRDPKFVHLDGLNLSRAWALRGIASALPARSPARVGLRASAARHANAGLAHVASGDYLGEHWLATFAVKLLTGSGADFSPPALATGFSKAG
jgi:hypothetical protein